MYDKHNTNMSGVELNVACCVGVSSLSWYGRELVARNK